MNIFACMRGATIRENDSFVSETVSKLHDKFVDDNFENVEYEHQMEEP